MSPLKSAAIVATLALTPACIPVCDDWNWNTRGFFEIATVDDVNRCLQGGADPNARDERGVTPLHLVAGLSDTPAIIAALIDGGADPNAQDEEGWTPLHSAAGLSDTPAIITALIEGGADPNARDAVGWTPLHVAAEHNETRAVVEALLDGGADAALRDGEGRLPIDVIPENSALHGTDAYWRLNEGRFD